jgi:hypothetical protein
MIRVLGLTLWLSLWAGTALGQRVFPEELPAEASAGPSEAERLARGATTVRPLRPDYSDPHLPVYFRVGFGLGAAFSASLDEALASHAFARSPILFQANVAIAARIFPWLWLGGRLGATGRGWARRDGLPAASATGYDLLGLVHFRGQLGRIFELGGMLGGGLGVGALVINDVASFGATPRLMVAAEVGFRVDTGIRILLQGELGYFPLFDLDRYGSDLDFGGGTLSVVVEARL